jgi:hypothetical protein
LLRQNLEAVDVFLSRDEAEEALAGDQGVRR